MCGIYFYIGKDLDLQKHFQAFQKIKHRGPESSVFRYWKFQDFYVVIGFHRLAIMNKTEYGEQPIINKDTVLVANAEIWNYTRYIKNSEKGSDCRAILNVWEDWYHLTPKLLDGEFAFVLLDEGKNTLFWAVDELSVRPLFLEKNNNSLCFSSEARALQNPIRVKPSSANYITINELRKSTDYISENYFNWGLISPLEHDNYETARNEIYHILRTGIKNRIRSDREVAFFLSGGLDSSIITALAVRELRFMDPEINIKTFTIGIGENEKIPDICAAKLVAEHLQTEHHELYFSYKTAINAIPDVIDTLESYDETTVRASVPMWLASRYISENFSNIKVIFSGEIADELFRGYQYNHNAPSAFAGRKDTIRLLKNVHHFDGLRADRCLARFGLELRLPFANKHLISHVLKTKPEYYDPYDNIEKYILRDSIDKNDPDLLPKAILWRSKQALSDASSANSSWKDFIKSAIPKNFTNETEWYKSILNRPSTVPYKWMPLWTNVDDSSATKLNFYIKDSF